MTPTSIYRDFFRPVAEAVPGVKTVMFGDGSTVDRMTADSRSADMYPCIFSLRPRYRMHDNGAHNYLAFFEAVFYVFVPAPVDDYGAQDAAYDQAEQMALAVLQQFKDGDGEACILETNTIECEPVSMMTVDPLSAYEVKLKLALPVASVFN
ncbi:hypothetical protein BLX24_31105 [Arsenicibacter rosenii]|uniref:Uncharacterized protein n=2 Tax=Arsenicibacter rosenii TaxID=1750698 RepID=A0A1S2VAF4_9BACT|nr:hypothetical protein BLX24_31105 [Arsenicibacter rosenii]